MGGGGGSRLARGVWKLNRRDGNVHSDVGMVSVEADDGDGVNGTTKVLARRGWFAWRGRVDVVWLYGDRMGGSGGGGAVSTSVSGSVSDSVVVGKGVGGADGGDGECGEEGSCSIEDRVGVAEHCGNGGCGGGG